jgi:hypothetical protein
MILTERSLVSGKGDLTLKDLNDQLDLLAMAASEDK